MGVSYLLSALDLLEIAPQAVKQALGIGIGLSCPAQPSAETQCHVTPLDHHPHQGMTHGLLGHVGLITHAELLYYGTECSSPRQPVLSHQLNDMSLVKGRFGLKGGPGGYLGGAGAQLA